MKKKNLFAQLTFLQAQFYKKKHRLKVAYFQATAKPNIPNTFPRRIPERSLVHPVVDSSSAAAVAGRFSNNADVCIIYGLSHT